MLTHKRSESFMDSLAGSLLVKSEHKFNVLVVDCKDRLFLIVFVISGNPKVGNVHLLKRHVRMTRIEESDMAGVAVYVALLPPKKTLLLPQIGTLSPTIIYNLFASQAAHDTNEESNLCIRL